LNDVTELAEVFDKQMWRPVWDPSNRLGVTEVISSRAARALDVESYSFGCDRYNADRNFYGWEGFISSESERRRCARLKFG